MGVFKQMSLDDKHICPLCDVQYEELADLLDHLYSGHGGNDGLASD